MISRELFIKKLKKLIKEKFKQQKIFAKELQINEKTVSLWLRGDNLPNLDILFKISEYCKIDISYFFNEDENANIIDPQLFNKVFALVYDLATSYSIEIYGGYFLACYDIITTTMIRENTDYQSAFNKNKALILKIVNK
ncbi:Helix-turn-helix domain protein [Candidatus Hepatincolaceae symbiont of Richtersius coronifer]